MSDPQGRPTPQAPQPRRPVTPLSPPLRQTQPAVRPRLNYFKAVLIGLVGLYGVACAVNPKTYRFLDRVDLVFHEAGHLIFGFFGEFIGMLGGSLMQVMIPAVVTGYFLLHTQRWSGMVTLFWVGQSLFNVSVYVKDARAQALPLLGGEDVIHDWNWVLGKLHLLRWDQAIGALIYMAGLLAVVASVVGGLYFSLEDQAAEE
jgi:hypothetical protein